MGNQGYADLIVVLSKLGGDEYGIEMRFDSPKQPGERVPDRSKTKFPFDGLRDQQLAPPGVYGRMLYQALFIDSQLHPYLVKYRELAQKSDEKLRIRLLIDRNAPDLHNLRWETLCEPAQGESSVEQYLTTDQNVLFSRFLFSNDWERIDLRSRDNLSVLLVVANPSNLRGGLLYAGKMLHEVPVADEIKRVKKAFLPIKPDVMASDPDRPGEVTLDALLNRLENGCDILYLVCHGDLYPEDPRESDSPKQPYLLLEGRDGRVTRARGDALAEKVRELPPEKKPRLVVLASCESADLSALVAALGPRLVESGVPAVVAMQGNIKMRTVEDFIPVFFHNLLDHGQIDRAMAEARGHVRQTCSDWWVPVLYLRLRGGKLWYQTGFSEKSGVDLWPGIVQSIQQGKCTPILGSGLLNPLNWSPRRIAYEWAQRHHFPMAAHDLENLPLVAQFITQSGPGFPRNDMLAQIGAALRKQFPSNVLEAMEGKTLADLIHTVYTADPEAPQFQGFNFLARLPFSIYISTTPDTLLEEALLRERGKVQELYFCWKRSLINDSTRQAYQNLEAPTVENPLVYHLFGSIREPNSLVLTEDNYFDYLMWINKGTEQEISIPMAVAKDWQTKALLFLGFRMEDWNFRVLFRSVLNEDRRTARFIARDDIGYKSVAVQIQPGDDNLYPDRAQAYLEDLFTAEYFHIFWGSAAQFLTGLQENWPAGEKQ